MNPQPKDILDRVERVLEYHRLSKHTPQSVGGLKPQTDPAAQPNPYRTFPGRPKISLPTGLLDLTVAARAVMHEGLNALPDSHVQPPQDLKTLATWLYMAYGVTAERSFEGHKYRLRAAPSGSALFPCEIYVAVFSVQGLEPGLYSFNPRDFSLTKLREGPETLAYIKRGRPDLAFLKSVPAVLLVSTIYCRSTWKYRLRGFRIALEDAGHLVANLVATANGLGITTMTRLKMNDMVMRSLIGIPHDPSFDEFEAVQAMVVWGDSATTPIDSPGPGGAPPQLAPIERAPLGGEVIAYGSIVATHYDCVAPGVPLRDVRPPFTELSPMPVVHESQSMPSHAVDPYDGPSLRNVLLQRRSSRDFETTSIPRDHFLWINQSAFRTGTFDPLHPDGSHLALIRPFWIIHSVSGIAAGIWYYHAHTDRWVLLRRGSYRPQSQVLCIGQPRCGNAAALCVMTANLHQTLHGTGPDVYRLANLEAGIAGQRLALSAAASGIGSCGIGTFYDDEIRAFLGMHQTGWEVMYVYALGIASSEPEAPRYPGLGIG